MMFIHTKRVSEKKAKYVLTLLMLVTAPFTVNAQAPENLGEYHSARVLHQGQAPAIGARVEEGWGLYSFLVNREGQVEDLVLLDSSGAGRAVEVTQERIRGIEFQPATMGGEPVVSSWRQQMVLAMEGTVGNPDFLRDYNAFNDAMGEQDFDRAERILDRLGERRIRGIHEFALLSLGRFQLGTYQGMSLSEQIQHLYRALSDSREDVIPANVRLGVQQSLIQTLLQANRFEEAKEVYAFTKSNLESGAGERFDAAFERVEAIKSGDQVYEVSGQLSETGAWLLPLYKRGFGITEGLAQLERAQLRCSIGSYHVALKLDTDYRAPETARDCSLLMQGEPRAEIKLVQF